MQLIVIVLQPMTPVTAVVKGVTGNKLASTANAVTQAIDTVFEASTAHVTTHDAAQVQSASRGIFVDLDLRPSLSSVSAHCVRFQVNSGCSCNTIHIADQSEENGSSKSCMFNCPPP